PGLMQTARPGSPIAEAGCTHPAELRRDKLVTDLGGWGVQVLKAIVAQCETPRGSRPIQMIAAIKKPVDAYARHAVMFSSSGSGGQAAGCRSPEGEEQGPPIRRSFLVATQLMPPDTDLLTVSAQY